MMKKVFALVVAAAMGLSSAAFAVQAATPVVTSNAASQSAPAKSTHMKTHHMKKNTEQKAQAAKKHHKASGKKSPAQKAQAAKKHHKKSSKKVTTPAA